MNQDAAAFHNDFGKAVALCNSCHQASGFGFIVYKLPDRPAIPAKMEANMKFTQPQLQNLVADLIK